MSAPPDQQVLAIDGVADWLGLDRKSVHRAARSGPLPARRAGREWRFLREEVAERATPGPPALRAGGAGVYRFTGPGVGDRPVAVSATPGALTPPCASSSSS
jgi:excisionase family DNA binding protein